MLNELNTMTFKNLLSLMPIYALLHVTVHFLETVLIVVSIAVEGEIIKIMQKIVDL